MSAPFDGPRLKLKRARKLLTELETEIAAYVAREPIWLEITEGKTFIGKKWNVDVREEVPQEFSAIIGDLIHNLRAALDLLACELVRLNGNDDDDVYFPFSESESEFDKQLRRRNMDRASPEVIALLHRMEPWPGGNKALRAVHDLDIIDKHQMLVPISDVTGTPDVPWSQAFRVGPIRTGAAFTVHPHQQDLPVGHRRLGICVLSFPIAYGTASGLRKAPFGGKPLLPGLESLVQLVDSVIESFASLY
jgi:hypothetical protein